MEERSHDRSAALSLEKKAVLQRFITLGELTASISHEVKNLLVSINGYCDLISEKHAHGDPIDQELRDIKTSAELAQKIFMELLQFSRGASAKERTETDLHDVIRDVLVIMQTTKKIKFETEYAQDIPPVFLYINKIKQVLINIVMNAVHAAGEEKGVIRVSTGRLRHGMGTYIRIKDNGCGMSAETIQKLFQPFFTTKEKGTGLGLSVCRDIMTEHNGSIRVESALGKGSSFFLNFLIQDIAPHPDIIDL